MRFCGRIDLNDSVEEQVAKVEEFIWGTDPKPISSVSSP